MTLDEELVNAIREDYRKAPIAEADQVMLGYVEQITLIASWFNYINRVADALGVGRD